MRLNILGREQWAHSGGLFGEYSWFFYCPSTGVSMAVAYNYPPTQPGPNPPGELLIALESLANNRAGNPATARQLLYEVLPAPLR